MDDFGRRWRTIHFAGLKCWTMRLMIVEDNRKMREMIKNVIKIAFRNVESITECDDGKEAIEQYDHVNPEWILMDLQMDTMDGLAASRIIKASHPSAKIIIVTSFDDAKYRNAARQVGACGYVLKTNLGELSTIISSKEEL